MGFVHRATVAAGVGLAVSVIAGCGSNGGRLLSQSQSNALSVQLNRVSAALGNADCSAAQRYLAQFQTTLNGLGNINSTLLANLSQGASTIQTLSSTQCPVSAVTTPKKKRPKFPHTTTITTPTETVTVPTVTVPTTTTYTTSTPSTGTLSTPSTSTTGGSPIGGGTTTTSTSTSTTPGNGGQGLGGTGTAGTGTTTTGLGGGN